jgi:serine/threonine protein kinase
MEILIFRYSFKQSYAVDVFSLGCVYYYVLTTGDHPFGEPLKRQSSIVNGEHNLEKLKSDPQGVYELINLMVSSDANMRPPLSDVLSHPIFWSKEKILAFFLDVSDRVEKEDETRCTLLRKLESDGTRIVRDDWRDHICPEVAMDLRRYRTYKGQSVRDLLRALRNKKNHYRELTPEAQTSLGHIPDQFTDYWITRFPELLPYTWLKFETIRNETIFSKYYPKKFSFNSIINGDVDEQYNLMMEEWDENNCDTTDGDRLQVRGGESSPDKSPKIDKNFWRAKSQFKYNKWRQRQQQNPNLRENPHNFTSFATTRYPQAQPNNDLSPDSDLSWRSKPK